MINKIRKFALVSALSAFSTIMSSCLSTDINYDKVPLAVGDEPYILAPGDYMDTKGFLHVAQTNVWALSQSDVYEYVRWVRDHRK